VRPEWIKLANGAANDRASYVGGTVVDVVYLGSITQLIVLLQTGERLTVHQLNDEVGATDPRPGEQVMLRWAAEHSYIVGSATDAGSSTT
jgi:putative spermidine/putrescine transport system ATP-binding protein